MRADEINQAVLEVVTSKDDGASAEAYAKLLSEVLLRSLEATDRQPAVEVLKLIREARPAAKPGASSGAY